jgi:hypothetical protein
LLRARGKRRGEETSRNTADERSPIHCRIISRTNDSPTILCLTSGNDRSAARGRYCSPTDGLPPNGSR